MRVDKAEKLVCPFMGNMIDAFCITTNCMAWKITKTKSDIADEQYVEDIGRGRKKMSYRKSDLPENECEGECRRLT